MNTITNLPLENSQFTSTWAFLFLTDGPRTQEVHSHLKSNEWVMEVTGHWAGRSVRAAARFPWLWQYKKDPFVSAAAALPLLLSHSLVRCHLCCCCWAAEADLRQTIISITLDTGHPTIGVSCYLKANRYLAKSILLSLFSYWVEYTETHAQII